MFDINGKVAIVTGGAGGIGKATVEAILAKGGLPVIADWDENLGKKTAEELNVPFFKVDVSSEEQVKNVVEETVKLYGHLDIIVNNAGICPAKLFHEYTTEEYRHIIGVNQDGVVWGCKYAINEFLKQGTPGAIVNVSSMMGIISNPYTPFYSTTKFGLRGLSKSLAIAYGRQGIRANTIHPGHVDTAIGGKGCGEEAYKYDCEHTPVGRTGVPEEIAHSIIFAIENEFLTGTEIVIDGGWTIQ